MKITNILSQYMANYFFLVLEKGNIYIVQLIIEGTIINFHSIVKYSGYYGKLIL